jgi:AcrR family transcriptional regulator
MTRAGERQPPADRSKMRYSRDHKPSARSQLLDHGARHAKKHGFRESGMDALAAAAGVTTGSLYKHFEGKSDFFAALLEAELQRTAQRFASIDPADGEAIGKAQTAYLSLQHVRKPDRGCPLPSLTPEVARADAETRAAYQTGLQQVHEAVARWTGSSDTAWALIAQNVGAVMLARAMRDEEVQRELLEAALLHSEALLKGDR